MRKLFRTSFLAFAIVAISAGMLTSCEKKEPTPSGGNGGNGGNDGPATVAVTGVSLNKQTLSLVEGGSETLTVTVAPSNATNKAVTWKSSDASTASVDNSGKVTAVKPGSATITVTTTDGSKTATCSVTVTAKPPVEVTGVSIEPSTLEIKEGETFQLKAVVTPADASQEVDWASPSTYIATVDQNGLITAVAPGTVRIAVRSKTYPDKQGFCDVTVKKDESVKGIALDASELNLEVGGSRNLTVIIIPEYASNKNVIWASSDQSIVAVEDGSVKALKEGTATITATSEEGGFKAECVVTVSKAAGPFLYTLSDDRHLCVNGEKDTMGGEIYDLCGDGENIYTYEGHRNQETGQFESWFCKNRQPVINITDISFNSSYQLSARNGVYALLCEIDQYFFTVLRAEEGGDAKLLTINTSAAKLLDLNMTVAPNGEIHVAGRINDSFGRSCLYWYKIAADGKVTETFLEENSIITPKVSVSKSGDVYIFGGGYDSDNNMVGKLFKNGKLEKTIDKVENTGVFLENVIQCGIFCEGDNVYTVIRDNVKKEIRTHNDGKTVLTLKFDQKIGIGSGMVDNPIFVTSGGEIYIYWEGADDLYHINRNDKTILTSSYYLTPFCVVE